MVSAHTFIKQFMEIKILIFFILILILGLSLEIQMDWSTLIKKVWKQKLSSKCENFKDFIQNNLIDLGYIGNYITWHNKKKADGAIFSTLVRSCTC